ncbi:phosphatidylinositol N-acetylglucosaminyltransferase subunit Q [Zerene cesonia]|uniref:phosphatidylinositol N-acetylglucosaminyltransferase subunit Q n=1 Tax=Zerene cesonia TaxID=33412 RepID=UPI0018E5A79C|nr:phosphatidylinositol N-acetylglucosaminyltransferase subunit Q [Zerene cesonia]
MALTKVFLPFSPIKDEVFFRGYLNKTQENTLIYITEYSNIRADIESKFKISDDTVIGYCSSEPILNYVDNEPKNMILINRCDKPKISELIIDHKKVVDCKVITVIYDINKLLNSETLNISCDELLTLREHLKKDSNVPQTTSKYNPYLYTPSILSSSMFIQHCYNQLNLLLWLKHSIQRGEKISIKQGNWILALIVDIILGYFVLEILLFDRNEIGVLLLGILEKLVNSMYSLLKWLMGAPAGLKLNNAFNKMLGKYFSYHVELWWLFLDVSGERLDFILHIYQYLGYFGLTFQAAIISDMLCITTFHSYCIYVYAARLFNIQISGLIALLRLFVGRKYNPLRGTIDSCEYTNQELFVGTVAFTILLLLLPTTLMYYIVFTMFRVFSLFVQYLLAKLIHLMQTLPLYVITLWITRSPKLAGNIFIEEQNGYVRYHLILNMRLFNKPLKELMKTFKPPISMPKSMDWRHIVSSVFTGKQII